MLAKIGDVEVWRILESVTSPMPLFFVFPDLTPEILKAHSDALVPGSFYTDPNDGKLWLTLPVQAFLLRTPHNLILVDACVGNHKTVPDLPAWANQRSGRFMAALAAAGATVADVDYVLCTHLHLDHVGWTTTRDGDAWIPTFPNTRVLATQADLDLARKGAEADEDDWSLHVWNQTIGPLEAAGCIDVVPADHEIDQSVRLFPTPGHTPGHVSVEISANHGPGGLVTGDALHSTIQCALPELSPMADSDPVMAAKTRRALLEKLATSGALAFGSHVPLPSVGRIVPQGTAYRWKPLV
jgi:glyoxylase-like metal-dependent hydrolase (beta-lactamase superfamily II)